jgi:hypothetical protein
MISRKIKLLAAVVGLGALATTVGIARTVHTQTTSTQRTQGTGGKVMGVLPGQDASPRRGILTCGTATAASACENIEMMLPINQRNSSKLLRLPIEI